MEILDEDDLSEDLPLDTTTNVSPSEVEIEQSAYYYGSKYNINWSADQCVAYAMDISLESYFQSLLGLEATRIIYASNDYCFRERTRQTSTGTLEIPFMNYYKTGYSKADRNWKQTKQAVRYFKNDNLELQHGHIRVMPVKSEYEITLFFNQHKDCEQAYRKLMFASARETTLQASINIEEDTLNIPMILYWDNIEFNPDYNENEWLEQNKIYSISISLSVDHYILDCDDEDTVYIANSVLLDFATGKDIDSVNDKLDEQLTEYFNDTLVNTDEGFIEEITE